MTQNGLRFKSLAVTVNVSVSDPAAVEKVKALKDKLEKACPVSNAISVPIQFELNAEAPA